MSTSSSEELDAIGPVEKAWWRKFVPVRPDELHKLYDESNLWMKSIIEGLVYSERRAWMVAFVMSAVSIIMLVGCVYAMKFAISVRPETFVYVVDKTTGIGEPLQKVGDPDRVYDEATNNYWISQFVQCRESFTFATYKLQYDTCVTFLPSGSPAFKEYYNYFDPDVKHNPEGVYAVFGEKGRKVVKIRSIIPVTTDKKTVQVRYLLEESFPDDTVKKTHWVDTLSFDWGGASVPLVNYLGFRVLSLRKDKETIE